MKYTNSTDSEKELAFFSFVQFRNVSYVAKYNFRDFSGNKFSEAISAASLISGGVREISLSLSILTIFENCVAMFDNKCVKMIFLLYDNQLSYYGYLFFKLQKSRGCIFETFDFAYKLTRNGHEKWRFVFLNQHSSDLHELNRARTIRKMI